MITLGDHTMYETGSSSCWGKLPKAVQSGWQAAEDTLSQFTTRGCHAAPHLVARHQDVHPEALVSWQHHAAVVNGQTPAAAAAGEEGQHEAVGQHTCQADELNHQDEDTIPGGGDGWGGGEGGWKQSQTTLRCAMK